MNIRTLLTASLLAVAGIAGTSTLHAGIPTGPQETDRLISRSTPDYVATDTFNFLLAGGVQTVITVAAKTSTAVIVYIYNPDGSLRTMQLVSGFEKRQIWFDPPATGLYKVEVKNPSYVYMGEYYLHVN